MKLIPLGVWVNELPPGGCSSAYLLCSREANILIDCGNGAAGQLAHILPLGDLSAIWISHMHADHFLDIIPVAHTLLSRVRLDMHIRIPLWLPPGGRDILCQLTSTLGFDDYLFQGGENAKFLKTMEGSTNFLFAVFDVQEYASDLQIKDVLLSFYEVRHPVRTYAVRASDGHSTFAYSADTAQCEALHRAARHADLFLCECTEGNSAGQSAIHLSAAQAGDLATQADVKELVLTHTSAERCEESLSTARMHFSNTVFAQQLRPILF